MNNTYGDLTESMERLYESMNELQQLACLNDCNSLEILQIAQVKAETSTMTFQEALDAEIEKLEYNIIIGRNLNENNRQIHFLLG